MRFLASLFNRKTAAPPQDMLNYVWVTMEKPAPGQPAACETAAALPPPRYLENVLRVARAHPDMQVAVWADFAALGRAHRRQLRRWASGAGPGNLDVRDLGGIAAYRDEPLFQRKPAYYGEDYDLLWQKADMARLIVLHHALSAGLAGKAFYSDFDLTDPFQDGRAQSILARHGLIAATSDRNGQLSSRYLENQFMGFTRANAGFLGNVLMRDTRRAMEEGYDGWGVFCSGFYHRLILLGKKRDDVLIHVSEIKGPNALGMEIRYAALGV